MCVPNVCVCVGVFSLTVCGSVGEIVNLTIINFYYCILIYLIGFVLLVEKIVKERKTNVKLNKCTIVHAFPFVCVFDLILIVSHVGGSRIKLL